MKFSSHPPKNRTLVWILAASPGVVALLTILASAARETSWVIYALHLAALPLAFGLAHLLAWGYWGLHVYAALSTIGVLATAFVDGGLALALPLMPTALIAISVSLNYLGHDMRMPYLIPGVRAFRRHRRAAVDVPLTLHSAQRPDTVFVARTVDLSRGGCYITASDDTLRAFEVGDRICIDVPVSRGAINLCPARVVAIYPYGAAGKPPGMSLCFTRLAKHEAKMITYWLKNGRKHERAAVRWPVRLVFGYRSHEAHTVDISERGVFIEGGSDVFGPGDKVYVQLTPQVGEEIGVLGEVLWMNDGADKGAQGRGIAVRFSTLEPRIAARLRAELRVEDAANDDEQVHRTA